MRVSSTRALWFLLWVLPLFAFSACGGGDGGDKALSDAGGDASCSDAGSSDTCKPADKIACTGNEDCAEDQVCSGKTECVAKPALSSLTPRIVNPGGVLHAGETQQLEVVGEFQGTVVDGLSATFRVDGAAGQVSVSGLLTASAAGSVSVYATLEGGTAESQGVVFSVVDSGVAVGAEVRVVVIDAHSKNPIAGAHVVLSQDGAPDVALVTDSLGLVTHTKATAGTPAAVHVFHGSYHYVSVLGTTQQNLMIPLQAVNKLFIIQPDADEIDCEEPPTLGFDLQNIDGVQGVPDFDLIDTTQGEVSVALAGFTYASLLDLNLDSILGAEITRCLTGLASFGLSDDPTSIPSNLYLKFNDIEVVDRYYLFGEPGVRTAWALGGRVSFTDIAQPVLQAVGGSEPDIGQIVTAVLPFFSNFYSGFVPDLALDGAAKTTLSEKNLPLVYKTDIQVSSTVPTLPTYKTAAGADDWLDGAVLIGGLNIWGQGFVVTGLTAGLDTDDASVTLPDGIVDTDPKTPAADGFSLTMAPAHSGVQGPRSSYAYLALALGFGGEANDRKAVSAMIHQTARGSAIPSSLVFDDAEFLGMSDASKFSAPAPSTSRDLVVGKVAGASFYQVIFRETTKTGEQKQVANWNIYVPANLVTGSTLTWTVPNPHDVNANLPDRTADKDGTVLAAVLRDGTTFADLFGKKGSIMEVNDRVQSYSSIDFIDQE